jgi:hypothetical protein
MPEFLDELQLRGLRARHGAADVLLMRHGREVAVTITRREGKVPIAEFR